MDKETVIAMPIHRHTWKRTLIIIRNRFYVTFSNCTVKKRNRQERDFLFKGSQKRTFKKFKKDTLLENEGHCPVCGLECCYEDLHIHHILPYSRFPQLWDDERNMLVCCTRCHSEIHNNPWRNIELMKAKAEELNIDLKEIYHL